MKVKVSVCYPWAGVPNDVEIIKIDEGYDEDDVIDIVAETASKMVWNRVGFDYEILD